MQRALQEIARKAGEGRQIHVFGVMLTVRIASIDTGGDFAIWEEQSPPNCGPPRHIHHYVDEAFQILEGRYRVWCEAAPTTSSRAGSPWCPRARRMPSFVSGRATAAC
jgi:mannose-6-phosphate isomerase-like protein (cupin superfamily)